MRITYHQFRPGERRYEIKRNGVSVGVVSAEGGRPTMTRWRATGRPAHAIAFAPTRHEAVEALWGES